MVAGACCWIFWERASWVMCAWNGRAWWRPCARLAEVELWPVAWRRKTSGACCLAVLGSGWWPAGGEAPLAGVWGGQARVGGWCGRAALCGRWWPGSSGRALVVDWWPSGEDRRGASGAALEQGRRWAMRGRAALRGGEQLCRVSVQVCGADGGQGRAAVWLRAAGVGVVVEWQQRGGCSKGGRARGWWSWPGRWWQALALNWTR
jgi:hypothetical protein